MGMLQEDRDRSSATTAAVAPIAARTSDDSVQLHENFDPLLRKKMGTIVSPVATSTSAGLGPATGQRTSDTPSILEDSQYIGVLSALISLRCWSLARRMITSLVDASIDPMHFKSVRESLIGLIDWRIQHLEPVNKFTSMKLFKKNIGNETLDGLVPLLDNDVQCNQISTNEEFISEIIPMLNILSHHLSTSPSLYAKICRVLKPIVEIHLPTGESTNVADMEVDGAPSVISIPVLHVHFSTEITTLNTLVSNVLLPSLSRIECNPMIATCLWDVISLFPFQLRYQAYEAWKGAGLGKNAIDYKPLDVVYAESKILHSAKAQLKRLSKENIKTSSRQIAKCTHSCSLVVFDFILSQIETYDNMIPFVVDGLKYTTELARDVLSFALVSQLHKDSDKLQKGDTHMSHWFNSLTKFIGTFYKKYPSTEIKGILHFLLQKLSIGESLDLLVLKELLIRMGGSETVLEVSSTQLEGLSGGKALQGEVMGAQVKDAANKKAVRILRETMISSGTALPLLLFIAQTRSKIVFKAETSQLKLISFLYDTCQDVLTQFTDFLVGGTRSVETMIEVMPPMNELINEIGLSIPVAFQLVRPLVRAALNYGEDPSSAPPNLQRWHPFSEDMKMVMRNHLPSEVWTSISVELYMTFWSLSLYDLNVPSARYELEIRRLKDKYLELDTKLSGMDDNDKKQKRQDMTKYLNCTKALTEENDIQQKHVDLIRKMITAHKSTYLSHVVRENSHKITESIMQYCVYPRTLISPSDALFSSQFFMLLHTLETPGFSTIHFIHTTVKYITPLIFCTTEYEAGFIGLFLNDMLATLNRWMSNKQAFTREAECKSCFQKEFDKSDLRINYDQYSKVFGVSTNIL